LEPKPRWSKPLERWLTRQFVHALLLAGRVTPRSALAPMGRSLGALCYRTMRRYRVVALKNLRRAFGEEWDEARIEWVARESFRQMGMTVVEFFLRQPRLTPEDVDREVRFVGQEYCEEAVARGNGVILVSAHYGNWEIMGARLARSGYRLSAISRTADDPGLEKMIEEIRLRGGGRPIPRRQAARQGLAVLRRNEILGVLLDQNTLEGGIFVPFFGHPASTATGPAVFALKTGAALLPTFSIREPDGSHTVKAWPPIYPQPTGDRARDIYGLTAEVTRIIELQIRERPELWVWLHNRWKLQPSAEPARAAATSAPREKGPTECKKCD
jgi:KDO2-lipid IV(A) lauroyltransferase